MITPEQIRNLSRKFNIDRFSVIREYLQIVFLSNLYAQKETDKIFFKGGTALRLLYDSFRFSEGLDFTSLLSGKKLLKVLEKILKDINLVVPNATLEKMRISNTGVTGFLSFKTEELKFPLNVHLDFSLREKPLTSKESILETLYPIGPYPVICHLEAEEILAEKIRAIIVRAKGRDFFDVWFLLTKQVQINWRMVNKKMLYYKKRVSFEDLVRKIKAVDSKKMAQDLGKFLPLQQRNVAYRLKELLMEKIRIGGNTN
jgi:predicted nucleotidyltransferase component of viral defense system